MTLRHSSSKLLHCQVKNSLKGAVSTHKAIFSLKIGPLHEKIDNFTVICLSVCWKLLIHAYRINNRLFEKLMVRTG